MWGAGVSILQLELALIVAVAVLTVHDDFALIVSTFVLIVTVYGALIVISPVSSIRTNVVGVCPQKPPK